MCQTKLTDIVLNNKDFGFYEQKLLINQANETLLNMVEFSLFDLAYFGKISTKRLNYFKPMEVIFADTISN